MKPFGISVGNKTNGTRFIVNTYTTFQAAQAALPEFAELNAPHIVEYDATIKRYKAVANVQA